MAGCSRGKAYSAIMLLQPGGLSQRRFPKGPFRKERRTAGQASVGGGQVTVAGACQEGSGDLQEGHPSVTKGFREAPFEGTLHEGLKEASPSEGFKGASPGTGGLKGA